MELELLASAYGLLECPRVDDNDRLYFSDMVLGGIHRRSPNGRIETVIPAAQAYRRYGIQRRRRIGALR